MLGRPAHRSAHARLASGGLVAVLVAGLVLGLPLASRAAATTLGSSTTFYGRGYGHGVGMAQYGAYGRATAGQSAATIVAHYFQGTTLSTISPTTPVRVLVLSGWSPTATSPLLIKGLLGTWSIDGEAGTFPASAQLALYPPAAGSWPLKVIASDGTTVLLNTTVTASFAVRPASSTTELEVVSKPTYYDTYRGVLRVLLGTTTVSVVNELGIDDYLRGVVPSEMPYTWPAEALKAQAIAARSYAKYQIHPSTGTWDLYDDTRSQVYHGILGEAAATTSAVTATAGVVLLSSGVVADALYHSADGGWTENNENVFTSSTGAIGTPISYLRGSSDLKSDGTSYDAASPSETWQTAAYSISQLSSIFGADSRTAVATLSALDLSHRGVSGRLIYVVLYGSGGSKQVSGSVFTSVFNAHRPSTDPIMRSTWFDFAPFGGTFSLSSSPTSRSVKQGVGTSYAISVSRTFFSSAVALTLSGLPAGATGAFSPASVSGSSSTLTVTTSKSGTITPVGTYTLTITGTGGGLVRTVKVSLAVTDGIAPSVSAPRSRIYAPSTMAYTTTPVATSWTASDPSGIASYTLERMVNGGAWAVQSLASATSSSIVQSLSFGSTYRYVVRATDGAGNTSGWFYGPYFRPSLTDQTSAAIAWSGTWTSVANSYASGGSLRYTTASGASASYTFSGSSVAWLAYRGPDRGNALVYVDGTLWTNLSLYSATYASKQLVFDFDRAANGTHTIKIVNLATAGHPRIDLDAFVLIVQS